MGYRTTDLRQLPRPGTWAAAAALALTFLLAGGGGGGGGGLPFVVPPTTNPPASGGGGDGGGLVASSSVAAQCAAPRNGIDPDTGAAYPDRAGSVDLEKSWVRSWIDETYLWYNEVPATLKAADYATPVAFFNVLKTPATTTPSGRAKDRFHFVYDTEVYRQLSQGGVSAGYGMETASVRSSPPRNIRIAFVEPNSPATAAGLQRGAKMVEVDGVDVVNSTGTANVNVINRAISPQAVGESHTFVFEVDGVRQPAVPLTAARITSTPVQNVRTIGAAGDRVGYFLFNDHITTSEAQLIAAVNQLKLDGGIQDLVLDMRYNGGGQLSIASRLAYMVAAPATTAGKTFELTTFNDKNPFHLTLAQTLVPFYSTSRTGQLLPHARPLARHRADEPRHLLGQRVGDQQPARRRRHGQPRGRHHLRQALRLLSAGQLRHHLLRDPVQGRQPGGLRRRLRAHLRRGRRFRPPARRSRRGPAGRGADLAQQRRLSGSGGRFGQGRAGHRARQGAADGAGRRAVLLAQPLAAAREPPARTRAHRGLTPPPRDLAENP